MLKTSSFYNFFSDKEDEESEESDITALSSDGATAAVQNGMFNCELRLETGDSRVFRPRDAESPYRASSNTPRTYLLAQMGYLIVNSGKIARLRRSVAEKKFFCECGSAFTKKSYLEVHAR